METDDPEGSEAKNWRLGGRRWLGWRWEGEEAHFYEEFDA